MFNACTQAPPPAREYELQGQILSVTPATREVRITHGDIKGFMPGMTMTFPVRDPSLLDGKAAGDLVSARLMVSDTDAWISVLQKTGTAPLPADPAGPLAGVTFLTVGGPVPETPLIDEQGHALALAEWRGLAVAVTFIYTRCPLPQYCPLMERRFAEVQRLAKADGQLGGRVRLLSVSFDPDTDRPDVLRAHAQRLGADPSIWRFATADRAVVDRVAAAFGVNVIRESDGTITHNLRTAVIGPDGHVVSIHDGTDWTAAQIADDLRTALATR